MSSWLFILADQSGADVAVLNKVTSRNASFMINGVHTAGFHVPTRSAVASRLQPGLSRLKVYQQYTPAERAQLGITTIRRLRFYGSLPEAGIEEDAANGVTATFMDPRWILGERLSSPDALTGVLETYTAQDAEAIAWGLVNTQNNRPGGDTFIRRDGTPTGTAYTVTFDRQPVLGLHQQLTNLVDGPDIDIDPVDGWADSRTRDMGRLHVYARQGTDRPGVVFRYGSGIGPNVKNMRRTWSRTVTRAQITATTRPTGIPIVDTYGSPESSVYGLREYYGAEADATTQQMLMLRTRGIVTAYQTPRMVVEITDPTANGPQFGVDYELGDTGRAVCKTGSMIFDAPARVHGVQLRLDQAGKPAVTLTTAEV